MPELSDLPETADPKTGDTTSPLPEGGAEPLADDALDALTAKIASDPAKTAREFKKLRAEAAKHNKAPAALAALQAQVDAAKKEADQEPDSWQAKTESQAAELASLQAEHDRLKAYEATIQTLLERRVAAIPDDLLARVPDLDDPVRLLSWLTDNADVLKPSPSLSQGKTETDPALKAKAAQAHRDRLRNMIS